MSPELQAQKAAAYWKRRSRFMYYKYIDEIMARLAKPGSAVLDVGSNGCPYLEAFDWASTRVSIDIAQPYSSATVSGIRSDFLAWQPERRFDIALCLQVLEHVPRPDLFLKKLLSVADIVIVSVPYKWPKGSNSEHIHDPIDIQKLRSWSSQKPAHEIIVSEIVPSRKSKRLIACYGNYNLGSNTNRAA